MVAPIDEAEMALIQHELQVACEECGEFVAYFDTLQCKEGCACGKWVGPCCIGMHGRNGRQRLDGFLGPDLLQGPGANSTLRLASISDLLPCRIAPWFREEAQMLTPVDAVSAELGLDKSFIKDEDSVNGFKADKAIAATYWLLATRPLLWDQFVACATTPSKRATFLLGFHLALRAHRGGLPPTGPVVVLNRFGIRMTIDLTTPIT